MNENQNKGDIVPVVVDLNELKKGVINESWLAMFGGWVETILGRMFGFNNIPISIKGNKSEVESFVKTLQGEKKYIDAWHRFGLDHAETHSSKAKLDSAVKNFEKVTSLKWPFKS